MDYVYVVLTSEECVVMVTYFAPVSVEFQLELPHRELHMQTFSSFSVLSPEKR
jgi:hypothetical protein